MHPVRALTVVGLDRFDLRCGFRVALGADRGADPQPDREGLRSPGLRGLLPGGLFQFRQRLLEQLVDALRVAVEVLDFMVEEGILALQERKRALADVALGNADQAAGLTRDDLLALLR